MGTREIADLLDKNHSDIKRSAERLATAGVLTQPLAGLNFIHKGNTYTEYRLNKRDSLVLVAQNSPEFTARIVDRWQELEAKQAPAIPTSYASALLEAGRLALEVEQQAAQLAIAAPKVANHDRFMAAEGSRSLRDTAKALGHGPNKFNKQLHADGYLFKQGGTWEPYAHHIGSGLFVLVVNEANGITTKQTRVTPKGMDALATRYPSTLKAA